MKAYNPQLELLHLVIMGSVDDGKSTFIGRLFYDLGEIYQDQLEQVKKVSSRQGSEDLDLSLLTDGLSAEREQKITIDVAYRYLSTPKRRFVIADVPGHEQYTRNMATGAANSNLALIVADAQKGLLPQSKRHLFISSLLGVPHVLVVINKMDRIGYKEEVFEKIKSNFTDFMAKLNIKDVQFVPVSSLKGDMVVKRGQNMPWYQGPTALSYLESAQVTSDINLVDFRFPVQYVIRPDQNFRGYAGRVESGTIKKGEEVKILPSGLETKVKSIIVGMEEKEEAFSPQSVVLTLDKELDVSRGDMIVRKNNLPEIGQNFDALIFWMSNQPLSSSKSYILKQTTKSSRCFVNKILYRLNIETLHREDSSFLEFNEIGRAQISTSAALIFDPYQKNKNTGSFILMDEDTDNTVGAGIIIDKGKTQESTKNMADRLFEQLQKKGVKCKKEDIEEAINQMYES